MTPERIVQVLEHYKMRVVADTGMSYRDLECVLHLVETGAFDEDDLLTVGINMKLYAPQG
ncbi:hypothetical protein AAY80_122 [Stenotrophomonas phage vB_SmaS-DLP_6]|nr:hypothetical protein AAY80_122 [Stenotrophomonas phage vB_SmaS-DLP_6]